MYRNRKYPCKEGHHDDTQLKKIVRAIKWKKASCVNHIFSMKYISNNIVYLSTLVYFFFLGAGTLIFCFSLLINFVEHINVIYF